MKPELSGHIKDTENILSGISSSAMALSPSGRAGQPPVDEEPMAGRQQQSNHEGQAAQILMEIQQIKDYAAQIASRDAKAIPYEHLLPFLEKVKIFASEAKGANTGDDLATTLKDINKRLQNIETTQASKRQENADSWAKVAERGHEQAIRSRHAYGAPTKDNTPRKQGNQIKQLKIRITNGEERAETSLLPSEEIIRRIQTFSNEEVKDVVALRKLPSGDLLVQTTMKETRDVLAKGGEWLTKVAGSVTVLRTTFAVYTHGVRVVNVNTAEQDMAIRKITEQNKRLHPTLEITRLAWPKQVAESGKSYSSIIIEVATAEMANRLIDEGLIEGSDIKICELFDKNCRIFQCFNCHKYGHSAKVCRNATACGYCAGAHRSDSCDGKAKGKAPRCAACRSEGHEAWSGKCQTRKKEKGRAKESFQRRPLRFYEAEKTAIRGRGADRAPLNTSITALRQESDGWTQGSSQSRSSQSSQGNLRQGSITSAITNWSANPTTLFGRDATAGHPGIGRTPSPERRDLKKRKTSTGRPVGRPRGSQKGPEKNVYQSLSQFISTGEKAGVTPTDRQDNTPTANGVADSAMKDGPDPAGEPSTRRDHEEENQEIHTIEQL